MNTPSIARLALVAVTLASTMLACGASSDSGAQDDTTSEALAAFDRQTVYDEVRHSAHAPRDLLSASLTDARLVNAVGWLEAHGAPAFYISAIRSDHHDDGARAHAGGHALDMYAQDGGQARALIQLIDQNPYVVEIGLGGAYKTYRHSIQNKMYFDDNSATHIHIGVVHAFGH